MNSYLIMTLSFFIGLYCIRHLRSYDIHERESAYAMILTTFIGGACAVAISIFAYRLLAMWGIKDFHNTFGALFIIGPIEEASKLIALLISLIFIRKEINEPTDGLIYMSCVALGFSVIENYFYVSSSAEPVQTMVLRLMISTPMHIVFSAFIGLAVFSLLTYGTGWLFLMLSLAYAIFVHGFYDLIIFNEMIIIFLAVLIKLSHMILISFVEYTTAISPFRMSLKEFIDNYKNPTEGQGIECLHCGNKDAKPTYSFEKIVIQKCKNCSKYITTKETLFHLFHHFGSSFKNLSRNYHTAEDDDNLSTLYSGNYASNKKKIAFFELAPLNSALEKLSMEKQSHLPLWVRSLMSAPEPLRAAPPGNAESGSTADG